MTGQLCGSRQQGNVFFLAGTFARGPIHRKCTVPADKYLFFPLVNYIVMPDGAVSDCASTRDTARAMTDAPMQLFAEVDGEALPALEKQRIATGCFNLNAFAGGPRLMSASNGYWVMLRPLGKGRHTVHLGGRLPSLSQDITYTLMVE